MESHVRINLCIFLVWKMGRTSQYCIELVRVQNEKKNPQGGHLSYYINMCVC